MCGTSFGREIRLIFFRRFFFSSFSKLNCLRKLNDNEEKIDVEYECLVAATISQWRKYTAANLLLLLLLDVMPMLRYAWLWLWLWTERNHVRCGAHTSVCNVHNSRHRLNEIGHVKYFSSFFFFLFHFVSSACVEVSEFTIAELVLLFIAGTFVG